MTVLAKKEISVSPARMGRPPLGQKADDTKTTIVRFDAELRARIDEARGTQPMAAFIRGAVEAELQRRAVMQSLPE